MKVAEQFATIMSHAPPAVRYAQPVGQSGDGGRLPQDEEPFAYQLSYARSRVRRHRLPPLPSLVLAALGVGVCIANGTVILFQSRAFFRAPVLASISLLLFAASGAAAASRRKGSRKWAARLEVGSFVGFAVSALICASIIWR